MVWKFFVYFLSTFLFFNFSFSAYAQSTVNPNTETHLEAVVQKVKEEKNLSDGGIRRKYQLLELQIENTNRKGEKVVVENGLVPVVNTVEYRVGDKVTVSVTKNPEGVNTYFITDYVRRDSVYYLFAIFVCVAVLVGGKRGALSIIGMAFSFLVIFLFILPQIVKGQDPILVAIISSIFIIPITFYLTHGINKKTTSAVLGTILALIITGVMANIFVDSTRLSGFTTDEASFLDVFNQGRFEMKGLLLAGIIIGALGVLDDITISQSAIVFKLKETSQNLSFWKLFKKSMDVGRDHIASMVNTLVLVYTGAALPLLLIFNTSSRPFAELINYEPLAEEIVRTLIVSMGLILAVPIVTFIAVFMSSVNLREVFQDLKHALR